MATLSGHRNSGRHVITFNPSLWWRGAKKNKVNNAMRGVEMSPIVQVNLGAPVALSTTYIVATQAVAGAVASTLAHATTGATYGRTLNYVSSSASDTTQTVTVVGTDALGQTQTETSGALTGVTPVVGKKAFVNITSVTASAAMVGNLSVGTSDKLGLPYACAGLWDVLAAYMDSTNEVATGTLVAVDATDPATATTGDVRGTWLPATATNGTRVYRIWMQIRPYPATEYYSKDRDSVLAYGVAPV